MQAASFTRAFLILLTAVTVISSQTTPGGDEAKVLTEKAMAFFQAGDLDDAIKEASKAVSAEKKADRSSPSYATALLNLARMKRDGFVKAENSVSEKGLQMTERFERARKAADLAADALKLYEEAIGINESNGRGRTSQTADAKFEFAWLTYSFQSASNTGKERVDRAEQLFAEAYAISSEARGANDDQTLLIALVFGNFYQKYDNYEKALAQYEAFISGTEKKHGPNFAGLVPALQPYAQILYATFQEDRSAAAVSRIEKLTGKKEDLPMGQLDLYSRSGDNVDSRMKTAMAGMNRMRLMGELPRHSPPTVRVTVHVTVDVDGKVTEAVADTTDEKLKTRAETAVRGWFIRPFSYNGESRKLRGLVYYTEPV